MLRMNILRWSAGSKKVCQQIPRGYANILLYDTLVGLRPAEACQSISLVHNELDKYLNKHTMILDHYKYPSTFIRNSKKAFISIVNEDIISLAKNANNCGYNALRNDLRRRKLEVHMGYCRKIVGTYLRIKGIEPETIDLLQGGIPKSIFARHYFRPDFDYQCKKVRLELASLHSMIVMSIVPKYNCRRVFFIEHVWSSKIQICPPRFNSSSMLKHRVS